MFFNKIIRPAFLATTLLAAGLLIGLNGGCAQHEAPPPQAAAFWPSYPDEPRIQYLRSIEKSSDIQPPKTTLQDLALGKDPESVLYVQLPYGVKMWQGRIYVCDISNQSVTIFDLHKKQTFVIGKGDADSMLRPCDIAIAPDGTKYVADNGRDQIFVYGPNDDFITSFAPPKLKPVALAVYQNELYACDIVGQRVVVLDRRTGNVLRTIGGPGTKLGQFIRPIGIAVDQQGFIYVMDVIKCQLQKFDRTGKFVMAFGQFGDNVGALARPKQIAVDKDGYIYVVDAAFQNVQIFDPRGRLLTFFGSPGPHLGAMNLPAGICVYDGDLDLFKQWVHPAFEPERLILVTNQYGPSKVAVYALGRLKPGMTVNDIRNTRGLISPGLASGKEASLPIGSPTTLPTAGAAAGQAPPPVFGPVLTRPSASQ